MNLKSITVTTQQAINYGAVLQCYALQQTIIAHGIENKVLNFPLTPKNIYLKIPFQFSKKILINISMNILNYIHRKEILLMYQRFDDFKKQKIIFTDPYRDIMEVLYNTPDADMYICGSDQVISARNKIANVRLLNFLRNNKPKFSYAASLEEYDWTDYEKQSICQILNKYEGISLRENFAKDYLNQFLNKDININIDPVFLLTKEQWSSISRCPDYKEPYILCYPLLGNNNLQKTVDELKAKTGYMVICVQPTVIKRIKADKYIFDAGPMEFLGLIKNANYVITTSFHGTAFSIIFEKPFYTLIKQYKSQRMTELLDKLSLSNRIIQSNTAIDTKKLDYTTVQKVLNNEIKNSNIYIDGIIKSTINREKLTNKITHVDKLLPEQCCGCGECSILCPTKAITMTFDNKGFLFPVIDKEKCINCGKCLSRCQFRKESNKEDNILKAFAFQHINKEVLKKSSSGGVFTSISDYVLNNNGVVYGAVLDSNTFMVNHKRATSKDERDLMCGSKYVQSNMNTVYEQVKNDITLGKIVLFTGTPCQCAALTDYIGYNPEKLFIIEILCYGAPSNKLLVQHIKMLEAKDNKEIINYNYRSKRFGYEHTHEIKYKNGKYNADINISRLLKLYPYSVRSSCYECRYDNRHRHGDITIGDMWDAGKRAGFYDHRGTSLLIVNNKKGESLLQYMKSDGILKEIDKKLLGYRPFKYPLSKPKNINQFWSDYESYGYEYIFNKYAQFSLVSIIYRTIIRMIHILHMDYIYERIKSNLINF